MLSTKDKVMSVVKESPDNIDMEKIIDKLTFIDLMDKGIKDLDNGKVVYEEEAKKVLSKWLE